MGIRSLGLTAVCLLGWSVLSVAGETAPIADLPSLDPVKWAGPPVSYQALRGKTVVVLIYATWCPICNGWSGELFSQLKDAVKDKPVVVLAVNADKSPGGVQQYLTQRSFFAPNVLHGYDPSIVKRFGFQSDLFQYVLIGPKGDLSDKGSAGSFFGGDQKKQFALPATLAKSANLGRFEVLSPEMPDAVKQLFWPVELGAVSDKLLSDAKKKLGPQEREAFDAALTKYLDGKLQRIQELLKGSVPEKFEAFEQATLLTTTFKSREQGRQAKESLVSLMKDKQFQRELAAKKNYDKTLQLAAAKPNRRDQLLQVFCKRFDGTHYAGVAKEVIGQPAEAIPAAGKEK